MNSRLIQPFALATGLLASMTGFARPQGTSNGIITSGPLDHTLVDSPSGTSFNIVASTFDDTGPTAGDWDFNFWDSSGFLFWVIPTYSTSFVIEDSGTVVVLHAGDVVGPNSTFSSQQSGSIFPAAGWRAGTDGYAGVKFICDGRLANPVPGGICYGYLHLTTTSTTGYPAVLDDAAFDGDGHAITIGDVPALGCSGGSDEMLCSGFDGSGSTIGPDVVYSDRSSFLAAIAPGYYENDFDDANGQPSGPLQYSDPVSGIAYIVDASSPAGLWNWNGVISTNTSGDQIVVTFTGTPVTAIGGNFWTADSKADPTPGFEAVITLSDGTMATLTSNGADDFRGFTAIQPIASIRIDASSTPGEGDNVWAAMDDLIVGSFNN